MSTINPNLLNCSNVNVLVIGDVMLDRYWHGSTSRISPEAPVPVVRVEQTEERAGGAGNVALNIRALGANTEIIGAVGVDEVATQLIGKLTAAKVTCDFQYLNNLPTITKLRVLSRHQQLIRLDFEEPLISVDSEQLQHKLKEKLKYVDVVLLSDYGKGTLKDAAKLIDIARKANVPVFVDPKSLNFDDYRGATVITPNLKEFEAVVGHCATEAELVEKGQALIKKHDFQALLVTRGEKGMTLIRPNEPEFHIPSQALEVYDVTGAGDTVIATLATAYASGVPLDEAVYYSNIAAGIAVGKMGAATVTLPELISAIHDHHKTDISGVVNEEQLLVAVDLAKTRGEKIVMTNGCFDILHAGHVFYLEQAKKLGRRLIVAVNDDTSVSRLKGNNRPINPLEKRMAVLAGLASVDWVVPFSEDTPERIICKVLPDVLVKGGDYRPEQIAGGDCVTANGGEVKILGFVEGLSTSNLINKISSKESL